MKNKWLLILVLVAILFYPTQGQALSLTCDYEDMTRLKKIATNVQMIYDVAEENNNVTFNAYFYNAYKEIYIFDTINNKKYSSLYGKVVTINNLLPDKAYKFEIRTDLYGCSDDVIQTLYLNTPAYNPYYNDEVCQGLTNYALCQKWNKNLLSYEDFKKTVNAYRENLNKINADDNEQNKNSIFDMALQFYLDYYYIILPIIVLVGGVIIYKNNKKDSFGL